MDNKKKFAIHEITYLTNIGCDHFPGRNLDNNQLKVLPKETFGNNTTLEIL